MGEGRAGGAGDPDLGRPAEPRLQVQEPDRNLTLGTPGPHTHRKATLAPLTGPRPAPTLTADPC